MSNVELSGQEPSEAKIWDAESCFARGIDYSSGREVEVDMVEAHKWFNIAAARGHKDGAQMRREVAAQMADAEIGRAQRAARDWLKSNPLANPLPVMAPFATDAKATAMVGTPTYGFSPFRLEPDERFLERFHGVDERISLDALRFGLPVLYDVVRRFCG